MDRLVEFLTHHYLLAGSMAALGIAYVLNEMASGVRSVSPQGLSTLVNQQNARVIDIRDAATFRGGHITGSENIPLSRLGDHIGPLKSEPERPIVVICNMGQSAEGACRQLRSAGLAQVFKLEGGIENWKSQSLPLIKK